MKRVVIPEYIDRIQISKSKQKKYYHSLRQVKSKKVREKVENGTYGWNYINGVITMIDENKMPVVSNPNSHGKPNIVFINGQDSGPSKHLLGAMKDEMRNFFEPFFKDMKFNVKDLPIKVRYEVCDTMRRVVYWDLDNRASIYRKVLQDIIRDRMNDCIKTSDDNVLCFSSFTVDYVPIESSEDRMIVVSVMKDTRRKLNKEFYIKEREKFLNRNK